MNTATKSALSLNMHPGAIFDTDLKLVEPVNTYQGNVEYFQAEIIKALTTDGFYQLAYPTEQTNSLDSTDIAKAVSTASNTTKLYLQLMTTKNEFDVIPILRTLKRAAIQLLADEWAVKEAVAADKGAASWQF